MLSELNNLNPEKFNNVKTKQFKLDLHSKIDDFINECYTELNGLDVLINNAGIASDNISIRLTEENWKKVIDINLTSTFLLSKHSIKKM